MKVLVPFVEGPGDVKAAPVLLRRLLTDYKLHDVVRVDAPFRVGEISSFKDDVKLRRLLRAALKRPDVGGILLLLDGDASQWRGKPFCPVTAGRTLVGKANDTGAGKTFSLAVVFACQEFESWLLAGVQSLAGQQMSDRRPGVRPDAQCPDGNLESSPRDAKGALGAVMRFGYKPTVDQAELTKLVGLDEVRERGLRSFRRLESALTQLGDAFRTGRHIATPPPAT